MPVLLPALRWLSRYLCCLCCCLCCCHHPPQLTTSPPRIPRQALRTERAAVAMQRLYRRQVQRKKQWQRLLDTVHHVVESVRKTRAAFQRAEADMAAKQAAAAIQAQENARRETAGREAALKELGEAYGITEFAALKEAVAFWHANQEAPARARQLELQLEAATAEAARVSAQLAQSSADGDALGSSQKVRGGGGAWMCGGWMCARLWLREGAGACLLPVV